MQRMPAHLDFQAAPSRCAETVRDRHQQGGADNIDAALPQSCAISRWIASNLDPIEYFRTAAALAAQAIRRCLTQRRSIGYGSDSTQFNRGILVRQRR
jgi:hypothetical protein